MRIGLAIGDRGTEVRRLQRILVSQGHNIAEREIDGGELGSSTLASLQALQIARGLPRTEMVDEATLDILVELEQRITININENATTADTKAPNPRHGMVTGELVDEDGAPVSDTRVALFERLLRSEKQLTESSTDKQGKFKLHYHRPRALTLLVRAYGESRAQIAESAISFAAPVEVEIDLTTAKDGVVRVPSTYASLVAAVTAELGELSLGELKENKETHELTFLAKAIDQPFTDVAYLFIANVLGKKESLRAETLFGIFYQGIPSSLDTALNALPDAGIDDAFMTEALNGVLDHTRASLSAALTESVTADVLPASYAETQGLELARLDDLRVANVGATPYIRGKTPLNELLAAGNVVDAVKTAFVRSYANNNGQLGPTWKALRANKALSPSDLDTLKTSLSAGELLTGNLPLVKDTLQRLTQKSLAGMQDLALLDENDWIARITSVDPEATSIPPVLPNETAQQCIARLAKQLVQRFAGRYPTTALTGSLGKATTSSFKTKTELVSFLSANPKLNIRSTNIDNFVSTNKLTLSAAAQAELKTAQRLYRVSPYFTSVEAMNSAGFQSAQSIYFAGRTQFLAQMTQPLGSAARAQMAYARAQTTYSTALMLYGRYSLAINGVQTQAMESTAPPQSTLDNLPSLQLLFGSLDYFQCEDCQSVLSPAAYLVDLLQYLSQFQASGGGVNPANATAALLVRRPEIEYLALDCSNTNVTLPYIDLVNEILEAAIAPPSPTPSLIDTTGTSDERRALPQNLSPAAYANTAAAIFPLSLPFDLAFAQTSAYLSALGMSLPSVLWLFDGVVSATAIACARLGINPEMLLTIDNVSATPWLRWGLQQNNNTVIDPKTNTPLSGSPDWVTALSKVPVLLNRSGLSLPQLYQLLEVQWVTQKSVTLQPGTMTLAGVSILDPNTDNMIFTGLTGDVLDRANRFLRLWNASGLQMWELDWALEPATTATLDDNFVVFLADAIAVQTRLKLPFQEVLSFWRALETRDVVNHLGAEDTIATSTYSEAFRNPTMLLSWSSVFVDVASGQALSGAAILPAGANSDAIGAALGLSAADIQAILTASGAANALTLPTLNVLLQYARLASSLSLTIPDLILWIALTQSQAFNGAPSDTMEFLRRLDVLRGTSIALHDLDYLLRGGSAARSSLEFTSAQATAVLQSIRDAIAKLPAAVLAAPTDLTTQASIQTIVVQALAAAMNVTANVVTPLLDKTGALPLSAATITALQDATVRTSSFASLLTGLTQVATGAALYTALRPTESELAFIVANAAKLGWLDPSALPLSTTWYAPFETLVCALELDQRQSARTPKLFDVLEAWVSASTPPTSVAIAINGDTTLNPPLPSLAQALDAAPADVLAIATYFNAQPPSFTAVANTLADLAMLTQIADALDTIARYKLSGTALVQLATVPATQTTASAALSAFQAQFPQSAWFKAVQPIEDKVRESRRDALVAYLLGPGANISGVTTFLSTDDIYDYYLIDPEMSACAVTTRLLQASLAVQQFVQQCFLNLFYQTTIDTTDSHWSEWSWRGQFRLWQANRQVFLYPENYVLPQLRKDASPFFTDLENDLRQSDLDSDSAQTAFETYLRKLLEVSNLVIAGHYNDIDNQTGSSVTHVFAHTRGTPPKWYYRTCTELTPGASNWSPWEPINIDIATDNVTPVIWNQRLYLIWTIYKQQTEKASEQAVPAKGGGSPQQPPETYWAIEVAMTELSAGQWQPKRTLAEKIYIQRSVWGSSKTAYQRPQLAFTLRARQVTGFQLEIDLYFNPIADEAKLWPHQLIATLTLTIPESPAVIVEDYRFRPDAWKIDFSQEPSYLRSTTTNYSTTLATPTSYSFGAQDLISGTYDKPSLGVVKLAVLLRTSDYAAPTTAYPLGTVQEPRIMTPADEIVFDANEPFFISDRSRCYFIQPYLQTISSAPVEINSVQISQWSTKLDFRTFYHPFARTLLRELEINKLPGLFSRNLQLNAATVRGWSPFVFNGTYAPDPTLVQWPYPGVFQPSQTYPDADVGESWLDFSIGNYGAYASYNWEVFYHGPMFVASLLLQNQRFSDTMQWLEYIFNPTDNSGGATPQRFWQFAPFYAMNTSAWLSQQIDILLETAAADAQQGITDGAMQAAIQAWQADPFDPHAIAGTRIGAYAKATLMSFLDNLIGWGDSLFAQYNAETVNQAEQLYILADKLLGQKPVPSRLPNQGATPQTWATLKNVDLFSNALVEVENFILAPTPPQSLVQGTSQTPTLPQLPGGGNPSTLLFCIPPNDKLLAYWDTIADRLYKIRHCMNLQGVVTPLPLYAPPINPLLLVEAGAAGASINTPTPTAPIYRFLTYLQRAVELANDVRAYGSLILSALEKKDAEAFAVLRANQELDIQTRLLDVKNQQVTEAQDQITALTNQQAVVQIRYDFYSTIAFTNDWETAALTLQAGALVANAVGVVLDMTAGTAHVIPSIEAGASGFGGTPMLTVKIGGENFGHAATAWGSVARGIGTALSEAGGIVGTLGSYHRRADEWQLQANLAQAELTQIVSQITAATDRLNIAQSEVDIQTRQITNAQVVSDFLTNKYTSAQLYDFMITQLTTVHTQAYQLAFSFAQQAQNAYQYELGRYQDSFIQFGYWDSQHKGLTAGESLLFDLRRMEAQYLAENFREVELTKHISLALTQPMALVQLRETGSCQVNLDEALFDRDNPGQYFRRLRSVALTVPCVVGPYTSVNASLTLTGALARVTAPTSGYAPVAAGSAADGVNLLASPTQTTATIATSSGQNDAGLFDVNLRDDRWLPFEGQGAISQWSLVLDQRDNNFDFSTITDVIIHVRYTARGAGDQVAANIVRGALKPQNQRSIMISARNTFGDAYYTFFNPTDPTATQQTLTLPLTNALFPFSNLGQPKLASISFVFVLTQAQPNGTSIAATFGPSSNTSPTALALTANANTDNAGNLVAALTSAAYATTVAPEPFTLTIPAASIPTTLSTLVGGQARLDQSQVEDVLIVITYSIN